MGGPTRPVQGWWPRLIPIPAVLNTYIDQLPQIVMFASFGTCTCAGAQTHTQDEIDRLACNARRMGPHREDRMSI